LLKERGVISVGELETTPRKSWEIHQRKSRIRGKVKSIQSIQRAKSKRVDLILKSSRGEIERGMRG